MSLANKASQTRPRPCTHGSTQPTQVVARLIESPPSSYPLSPLQYLIGCYERATNELRNNRAVADSPELCALLASAKELIVSYAALTMQGVVPQVWGMQPSMDRRQYMAVPSVRNHLATQPSHCCITDKHFRSSLESMIWDSSRFILS